MHQQHTCIDFSSSLGMLWFHFWILVYCMVSNESLVLCWPRLTLCFYCRTSNHSWVLPVRTESSTTQIHSLFLLIDRNLSPPSSLTSKEGSLTTRTGPSPQCPGPGGTARETHLMLRYCSHLHTHICDMKMFVEIKECPSSIFTDKEEKVSKE